MRPQEPPEAGPDHRDAHVLLVEDNMVNQRVAARMLEGLGCRVDVASDGYEALTMVTSDDLVLMDIQMPTLGAVAVRDHRVSASSRVVRLSRPAGPANEIARGTGAASTARRRDLSSERVDSRGVLQSVVVFGHTRSLAS